MQLSYYPKGGHIEVITGPMYSGKTTTLMARIRKDILSGRKGIVIKPSMDDRHATEELMSHDGEYIHALSIPCNNEDDIRKAVDSSVDVVAIDEGQFFSDDLVDVCERLANEGKRVIVAGVDMDYRCLPFNNMARLMAVAEVITKLTSTCDICGEPAQKIQRHNGDRLSSWDEPTIIVGDKRTEDSNHWYEARCRKCWIVPPRGIKGGIIDE